MPTRNDIHMPNFLLTKAHTVTHPLYTHAYQLFFDVSLS